MRGKEFTPEMVDVVEQSGGTERTFSHKEIIVSKTDLEGRFTYANRTFLQISDFAESALLGQPHNLVRHPFMPRTVFHLLWKAVAAQREVFAYVVNRAKNGDFYWVLAHFTPSYDTEGNHIGYHSNQRLPHKESVETIKPIYEQISAVEQNGGSGDAGMMAGSEFFEEFLRGKGMAYDEFVQSV